jgi:hypothetical protein
MFDSGVLSLSILTNKDSVDVVVSSLESLNRHARPNIGEEVESSSESEVQGDMALSNCHHIQGHYMTAVKQVLDVLGVAKGPICDISERQCHVNSQKSTHP